MNKGIYIALSGAIQKSRQMDLIAQNIANASTPGYKKDRISFRDHLVRGDNQISVESAGRVMTKKSEEVTDFSGGALKRTGNSLDVAINGDGFFALENGKYTRNGNFKLDGEGNLVNQSGLKVLGDGGPLTIQGSKIDITPSGEILVDNISSGTLQVVDFPDKNVLVRLDGGVFTTEETGEEIDSAISQGFLEESNVNAVRELVNMINSQREFETYQKMIQSFDEAAGKSINNM